MTDLELFLTMLPPKPPLRIFLKTLQSRRPLKKTSRLPVKVVACKVAGISVSISGRARQRLLKIFFFHGNSWSTSNSFVFSRGGVCLLCFFCGIQLYPDGRLFRLGCAGLLGFWCLFLGLDCGGKVAGTASAVRRGFSCKNSGTCWKPTLSDINGRCRRTAGKTPPIRNGQRVSLKICRMVHKAMCR